MYKNWKILKSELEEKQEEYTAVAEWCNETQKYSIEEDGEYYKVVKIPEPTIEEKQEQVRQIRNSYLSEYVDPVVSNPLRWADMTEEEQQIYADYRRYLLDYTNGENWWENYPKTLEEWRDDNSNN